MSPNVQCSELQALSTSAIKTLVLEIVMFDVTPDYPDSAPFIINTE